jgi:hypothetical protein
MPAYLIVYFILGLGVFWVIRFLFKKAGLETKAHEKIWIFPLWNIEGWIIGPLIWPLLAVLSLFWFAADFLHAQGKKKRKTKASFCDFRLFAANF